MWASKRSAAFCLLQVDLVLSRGNYELPLSFLSYVDAKIALEYSLVLPLNKAVLVLVKDVPA